MGIKRWLKHTMLRPDFLLPTANLANLAVTAAKLASDAVETAKIAANAVTHAKLNEEVELKSSDVAISSAEILNLHTAAKELVAAPGANKAIVFEGAIVRYTAGATNYQNVAAGDDLKFNYTDGSGNTLGTLETTGTIDTTTNMTVWVPPATANVNMTPNAALVAALGGAVTDGNGTLKARVYYRVVPTNI